MSAAVWLLSARMLAVAALASEELQHASEGEGPGAVEVLPLAGVATDLDWRELWPGPWLDDGLDAAALDGDEETAATAVEAWRADPIDLNTATREELEALPDMTMAAANVILGARPLASLTDFLRLRGLPPGLAESLLPYVHVQAVAAPVEAGARGPRGGVAAPPRSVAVAMEEATLAPHGVAAPPGSAALDEALASGLRSGWAEQAGGRPWPLQARGAGGVAWGRGAAPAPLIDLSAQSDRVWDVHLGARVVPPAPAEGPAGQGARGRPAARGTAAARSSWGAGWPLGRARLLLQAAHLRGRWGSVSGVLGDYTAGFAEGLTLGRGPRRGATGWALRPPPRFVLPRGRWTTPAGWQGAAVSWVAPSVSVTALTGLTPQPWGGGAVQVQPGEGVQLALVGYGTSVPPLASSPRGQVGAYAGAAEPPRAQSSRTRSNAAPPPTRGALGLGLRLRHGNWQGAGEASRGLPAGWAWHAGSTWQPFPPLQMALRWRGATAAFRHALQRGGLHAPWTTRAGTQAQADLHVGTWRSVTRADVDLPRWRLAEGVHWAVTPWEHLRLHGHTGARPAGPPQHPAPLPWSLQVFASTQRLRGLPCSLALRASTHALRSTARVRWHLLERTALSLALTASTPMPHAGRGIEGGVGLDVQQRWDRWDVVARGWSGRTTRWEHAVLLLLGART